MMPHLMYSTREAGLVIDATAAAAPWVRLPQSSQRWQCLDPSCFSFQSLL